MTQNQHTQPKSSRTNWNLREWQDWPWQTRTHISLSPALTLTPRMTYGRSLNPSLGSCTGQVPREAEGGNLEAAEGTAGPHAVPHLQVSKQISDPGELPPCLGLSTSPQRINKNACHFSSSLQILWEMYLETNVNQYKKGEEILENISNLANLTSYDATTERKSSVPPCNLKLLQRYKE